MVKIAAAVLEIAPAIATRCRQPEGQGRGGVAADGRLGLVHASAPERVRQRQPRLPPGCMSATAGSCQQSPVCAWPAAVQGAWRVCTRTRPMLSTSAAESHLWHRQGPEWGKGRGAVHSVQQSVCERGHGVWQQARYAPTPRPRNSRFGQPWRIGASARLASHSRCQHRLGRDHKQQRHNGEHADLRAHKLARGRMLVRGG